VDVVADADRADNAGARGSGSLQGDLLLFENTQDVGDILGVEGYLGCLADDFSGE
jgi:hypothetical protein